MKSFVLLVCLVASALAGIINDNEDAHPGYRWEKIETGIPKDAFELSTGDENKKKYLGVITVPEGYDMPAVICAKGKEIKAKYILKGVPHTVTGDEAGVENLSVLCATNADKLVWIDSDNTRLKDEPEKGTHYVVASIYGPTYYGKAVKDGKEYYGTLRKTLSGEFKGLYANDDPLPHFECRINKPVPYLQTDKNH